MKLILPALLLLAMSLPSQAAAEHVHDGGVAAMAKEHKSDSPHATPIAGRPLAQKVYADYYDYFLKPDGKPVSVYLVRPFKNKLPARLPGVILIHEWWGLNDNVEAMARQLSSLGYLVLAVDLYNGVRAKTPDEAASNMKAAVGDMDTTHANLKAAYALLKAKGATRVGTMGWCFGGAMSLQATLAMPKEIDATVIYYGKLETDPAKLPLLKKPVLGLFGGTDGGIPVESVRAFEATLKAQGTPVDINVYAGVGHAFANPSGKNYMAEAAEDAWNRTTRFLATNLKR